MFSSLRNCQTVFPVAAPFHILTCTQHCMGEGSQFLQVLVKLIVCVCVFIFSHPSGYEVISHCGFDLYFPKLSVFSCVFGHWYIIFGEMSMCLFYYLKKWVTCFVVEF